MLQNYKWETQIIAKSLLYLNVLDMLATAAQDSYPYHVDKGA